MRTLPPIDAHAHIDDHIDPSEIEKLGAVVFAVTRTLDEADAATQRNDRTAIWGVGCHPGLIRAQQGFKADRFEQLLGRTVFAGELGLDGKSRVPIDRQMETLSEALRVLHRTPRITSLHSYGATCQLLELLTPAPPAGIILHWWLGDAQQTRRAVNLGCFFSVNMSSVRRKDVLAQIPPERILTETDHPFGDRRSRPRRPGLVSDVERAIGHEFRMNHQEVRRLMWSNLRTLISDTECSSLLPRIVRVTLAAYT